MTATLWDQVVDALKDEYKLTEEWKTSARGRSLRLKRGERIIVYLIPSGSSLQANFVLGGRAVEAARKLPGPVVRLIDTAPRCAAGTGVRFEVKGPEDIAIVQRLARIKLDD